MDIRPKGKADRNVKATPPGTARRVTCVTPYKKVSLSRSTVTLVGKGPTRDVRDMSRHVTRVTVDESRCGRSRNTVLCDKPDKNLVFGNLAPQRSFRVTPVGNKRPMEAIADMPAAARATQQTSGASRLSRRSGTGGTLLLLTLDAHRGGMQVNAAEITKLPIKSALKAKKIRRRVRIGASRHFPTPPHTRSTYVLR